MKKQQKKFTVVLRYPDYYTDEWPTDTYLGVIEATAYDLAAVKMQVQLCRRINRTGDGQIEDPADLAVVIVIEGTPKVWLYPNCIGATAR
jgi:hypothetical protein